LLKRVGGRKKLLEYNNEVYRVVDLKEIFNIKEGKKNNKEKVVIITEGRRGNDIAIVADEIIDKQEIVIKDLGSTFRGLRTIGGGTILNDGQVGLIIDVYNL